MVSVSCFCVGKELLIGKTVNTNAHWIGARLFGIGTVIDRILVVTDSLDEISSGLNELLARRPDFIIVIGGLGPTPDDMTLKGVALALGRKVEMNSEAVEMMKQYFAVAGRTFELTPARKKMAMLPERSTPLPNSTGTAPGVRIELPRTVVFCLPGVPREMKAIYKASVHKEIREKVGRLYTTKIVMHLAGVYESALAPWIAQALKSQPAAYIKSHPKGAKGGRSSVELDIVMVSPKKTEAESETGRIASFFEDKIAGSAGSVLKKTAETVGR
ncbi:MAG: competence damage-inducible protein A [Nitrososphaerota archaeon]|nr:competence damage-inducible protein A [Nitrososphaerota archaeon]